MSGVGIGELVWLVIAVIMGLGVVITWIIKSEMSRNLFRDEIKRLKSQLASAERDRSAVVDEINAMRTDASFNPISQDQADPSASSAMIGKMAEKIESLEKDNLRLTKELNEARSSLEEVYKALCSK